MAEYIEREALLNSICYETCGIAFCGATNCAFIAKVCSAPAADVSPVVHGLWMPIRESEMTGWDPAVAGRDPIGGYICSACKEEAVYDCNDEFVLSNYCPNCGAKMDGGADNEDD